MRFIGLIIYPQTCPPIFVEDFTEFRRLNHKLLKMDQVILLIKGLYYPQINADFVLIILLLNYFNLWILFLHR